MTKIDFLRFDGGKINEWFSKAEEFFVIDNISEEVKVGIVFMYFDGVVLIWY